MNRHLLGAAIAILAVSSAPAFADTTTVFTDQTAILSFTSGSGTAYGGPGFSGPSPSQGDYLGSDFNTTGLKVIRGANTLELQYTTTFSGVDSGGATARYADIFLAPAGSLTAPVANGAWGYGISLGYQDGFGGVAKGFYTLNGHYQTSNDIWASQGGWIYGGEYIGPDGNPYYSPTRVTSGASLDSNWGVQASSTSLGGGNYLLDVILTAPAGGLDNLISPDLDIFWGTGDCSNDALFAALDAPSVPEPVSLSLLGAGVIGAAAFRRKKKQS